MILASWFMPPMPTLERLRKEHYYKFKGSLG